jgi:conjugative transfer region protein TrbK
MNTTTLKSLPKITAGTLIVLVIAACTIHLRGDEDQVAPALSTEPAFDPLATKLAECRSVAFEQKDALSECRKAWAEKRRQFLGKEAPPSVLGRPPQAGSSVFVAPTDERRLPSDYPPTPKSGRSE